MAGIGRKNLDKAGGVIVEPCAKTVFANYQPVSLDGDLCAPHGIPPHTRPRVVSNLSPTVIAEGLNVVKEGSVATCGHTVIPGSPDVIVP